MITKCVNMNSDNPRHDLFASALKRMDDREFAWAQVHYENQARKWPTEDKVARRDLVRAETARRNNEQRGQVA